jgi:hypothetical protein
MNCRYCNLPIEHPVTTLAYWSQTPDVCHPECKKSGERQEAIDCQIIDADCNDCKFFKRGIAGVMRWTGLLFSKDTTVVPGHCLKFNRPTTAYPHFWTGRDCFEHRRIV